jgi:hypothetical protein
VKCKQTDRLHEEEDRLGHSAEVARGEIEHTELLILKKQITHVVDGKSKCHIGGRGSRRAERIRPILKKREVRHQQEREEIACEY